MDKMKLWRGFVLLVVLLLCGLPCRAQGTDGSSLRVYVLTMQPGDAVYEKFGHNAIWIHDSSTGTDTAYNYGQFTFADNFVWKFLTGRMLYWVDKDPAGTVVHFYAAIQGRTVWAQELNLTPRQRKQFKDLLDENCLPKNSGR